MSRFGRTAFGLGAAALYCAFAISTASRAAAAMPLAEAVDPERLSQLPPAEFDAFVYSTIAYLDKYRAQLPPETALRQAYRSLGEPRALVDLRVTAWLRLLRAAGNSGALDDSAQRAMLEAGKTPVGARGSFSDRTLVLARVVPGRKAPELVTEVGNLELVASGYPIPQDRRKAIEAMFLPEVVGASQSPDLRQPPTTLVNAPQAPQYSDVEMELGRSYNLGFWGGPDREFVLIWENPSSVQYAVLDYGSTRIVWRTDVYGYNYALEIPAEYKRTAPKTNAISLPGSLSKLYPIYSAGNIVIYFNDTLHTAQNHRRVVIETR